MLRRRCYAACGLGCRYGMECTRCGTSTTTTHGEATYFTKLSPYHNATFSGCSVSLSRRRAGRATRAHTALCFQLGPSCFCWMAVEEQAASPRPRAVPLSRISEAKGRVSMRIQSGFLHHVVARWIDLQQWGQGSAYDPSLKHPAPRSLSAKAWDSPTSPTIVGSQ